MSQATGVEMSQPTIDAPFGDTRASVRRLLNELIKGARARGDQRAVARYQLQRATLNPR
ncbi:MAG TPA: hypothetical protein VGL46_13205 [Pseudonocardiaceae bacterium]